MQLRYRYRVYPTPGQQDMLARSFGCVRVVFNDALRARRDAYAAGVRLSDTEVQKRVVTEAKKTPQRAWLAEVASVVLVQACQDARRAYRNWFDSLAGKRKGRKVGAPRFRSRKDNRQSIRLTRNGFGIRDYRRLYIAKVGEVKVAWSRELPSEPSSVSIIKDAAGRYFASFVVETSDELLAECDAEVADARNDWAHKQSTALIRENQAVYVEDVCVAGLGRTRLAKSVYDAGWGLFTRMVEEKAARYGRTFIRVDRWLPSSQLCSECGRVDGPKPLSVREWICPCGAVHDRDLNAAENILAAGRAERRNACGETISLPA